MPLYEYKCKDCEELFEVLQPASVKKATCPACGSRRTQKQITTFGFLSSSRGASASKSACSSCSGKSCSSCR